MRLNIFLNTTTILLLFFFMSACSDDNETGQNEVPTITIENDRQLVFETEGGQADVNFTSTAEWTAEVDQEWCSVTPDKGNASYSTVRLSVAENDTPDERNATLVIKSGQAIARMTFVQKQKDALTVTSNRIETDADGGEITVEVKANIPFEYSVEEKAAEWLTAADTRSMSSTQLRFKVSPNESFDKREGKIIISSGELSETVIVYQDGEKMGINLTQDEYTIGSDGGTVTVELRSNVPFQMYMIDNVGWLNEVASRSYSTYTKYFEVAPNEEYDYRSARIAFFNEELGLSDTVTISQVQKDAILVANKEYTVDAMGGVLDFSVNTNVEFATEISENWIHQAVSARGLQEVPLSFIIDINPDQSQREAVISFKSGEITQEVKVIQPGRQDKGVLRIVHNNQTFTVPLISGTYFSYGRISWGDGQEEVYQKESVHNYNESGSHTISIELLGAEDVTFNNLIGITELELSDF